jgi:bifunctional non-homologous end joining protein LigD
MFVGHSGSEYKEKEMVEILKKLKKVEVDEKPFVNDVDYETTPHWIKPILVANLKFATWTSSGKIRKPATFLRFRDDKDPKNVVREIPLAKNEEEKVVHEKPKGEKRS